jgi:hypothetical protein
VTTTLVVSAVVIVALMAWCTWAWYWPITSCSRCRKRRGRGLGSTKYGYNRCRKCRDTPGEQVRLTARLISSATGAPVHGMKKN